MILHEITDTHVHLWDPSLLTYPWLSEVPSINKKFVLDDFNLATQGVPVSRMVFVQCECLPEQALEEVAWVSQLAINDTRLKGIVAYCPMESPSAIHHLAKLAENPLVKGIRRMEGPSTDPLCLSPVFLANLKQLPSFSLSFDICIKSPQLPETIQMVAQCPDTTFILDHFGKPAIAAKALHAWAQDLKKLAAFPNVYCKLSGLITEADWNSWQTTDLQPYYETALELFGAHRLLFGGDWPVSELAGGYTVWWNAVNQLLSGLSTEEQRAVLHHNATVVYGL